METPRVTRIRTAGKPACEATVTPPAPGTRALLEHARTREERNLRPNQCGRPSEFAVDRKMMCPTHAGEAALRILLERG